jgi:hypothetical protein
MDRKLVVSRRVQWMVHGGRIVSGRHMMEQAVVYVLHRDG